MNHVLDRPIWSALAALPEPGEDMLVAQLTRPGPFTLRAQALGDFLVSGSRVLRWRWRENG